MSVAGTGELIARGRDAEVYALDDGRVLRLYRGPGPTGREMRVMAWARSHGYPVPQVYERTETDLILDRLHGPMARLGWSASRSARRRGRAGWPSRGEAAGARSRRLRRREHPELDKSAVRIDAEQAATRDHGPVVVGG